MVEMEEAERLMARARELVKIPYRHGHSDVGDTLVGYLKGELTFEVAMRYFDGFEQDYRRSA